MQITDEMLTRAVDEVNEQAGWMEAESLPPGQVNVDGVLDLRRVLEAALDHGEGE